MPDEDREGRAIAVLARLGTGTALVPGHWRAEVGNGLLMAVRRGRLVANAVPMILAQVEALALAVDAAGGDEAWGEPLRLALTTGPTLYDAL